MSDDVQKKLNDLLNQAQQRAGIPVVSDDAQNNNDEFLSEEKNEIAKEKVGLDDLQNVDEVMSSDDSPLVKEEDLVEQEKEANKGLTAVVGDSREGKREKPLSERLDDLKYKEEDTKEQQPSNIKIMSKEQLIEPDSKEETLRGEDDKNELTEGDLREKIEGEGEDDVRGVLDEEGSILNIAPTEKQEALATKMKQIELGKKEMELEKKAATMGLGYINLKGLPIMPEALRLINEDESRKKGIICFLYRRNVEIRLAILDNTPEVEEIVEKLKLNHKDERFSIYLTSLDSMSAALKLYDALPKIIKPVDEVKVLEADIEKAGGKVVDLEGIKEKIKGVSTTEVFSLILASAIKLESSDIHIEAEEHGIQVRFRIDGVLHDVVSLDRNVWKYLMARIKLSSKLKLNISDKPQDGRFSAHIGGQPLDFRVSTIPTAYGESVVMRILYHNKVKKMTLDNLGLSEYNRNILEEEIKKPNGLMVVTGPTGAGKTTTLYAILNKLNSPDNKIITVEDPVEYRIEGINQSEINESRGYTFAKALRSIVRQDPDIILVGEIRDKETVDISLNAALTGHLVFSTIHTNDAAGAIPRFLSLGAKTYLLSPAINVIVAQRLVRRICLNCKTEVQLSREEKDRIEVELRSLPENYRSKTNLDINNLRFYKGKGCNKCAGLGYKGQVGIFEVLQVTDAIKEIILSERVSEQVLKKAAINGGMVTMAQDGIVKASEGLTSLEEVFRVT